MRPGAAGADRHPGTKVSESMSPTLIVIGASVSAAFVVWGSNLRKDEPYRVACGSSAPCSCS